MKFTCKSRFTSLSITSFVLGAYVGLLLKSSLFSVIDLNPTFSDIPKLFTIVSAIFVASCIKYRKLFKNRYVHFMQFNF